MYVCCTYNVPCVTGVTSSESEVRIRIIQIDSITGLLLYQLFLTGASAVGSAVGGGGVADIIVGEFTPV